MFDCHFKRLSSARGSVAQLTADTEHGWLLLLHTGGYCGREGAKTICYVATVSSQDPGDVMLLTFSGWSPPLPRPCDFRRQITPQQCPHTNTHTYTQTHTTTTEHQILSTVRQLSNGHIKHLTRSRTTEEDSGFVFSWMGPVCNCWALDCSQRGWDECPVFTRKFVPMTLTIRLFAQVWFLVAPRSLKPWDASLKWAIQFTGAPVFLTVLATAHNFDNF